MSALISEVNSDAFGTTVASSTTPVLVDFWAPWCGPCRAIAPVLEGVAKETEGKLKIVKVNVDDNGELAAKYGIRFIPTLLLFKPGSTTPVQIQAQANKDALKRQLSGHLA